MTSSVNYVTMDTVSCWKRHPVRLRNVSDRSQTAMTELRSQRDTLLSSWWETEGNLLKTTTTFLNQHLTLSSFQFMCGSQIVPVDIFPCAQDKTLCADSSGLSPRQNQPTTCEETRRRNISSKPNLGFIMCYLDGMFALHIGVTSMLDNSVPYD